MIGCGVSYNYYNFENFKIPKLHYTNPPFYFFIKKWWGESTPKWWNEETSKIPLGFRIAVTQDLNHNNNDGTIIKKSWEYSASLILNL